MGDVYLYKGRQSPHWVAAHHQSTRDALARHSVEIAAKGQAILSSHHMRTRVRFHDLLSPEVKAKRYGQLDWIVYLEAVGPPGRAIGIEYGHEYESAEINSSGPWGRSGGLHVLGKAISIHEVGNK